MNLHDRGWAIEELKKAAESVCKVIVSSGTATGFLCCIPFKKLRLIGLLTNEHVITREMLTKADGNADFKFDICFETASGVNTFKLSRRDNVVWWFTSEEIDVTFLELHSERLTALAKKKIHPLRISYHDPMLGLPIAVVQYPDGGKQKLAFSTNEEIVETEFKHTIPTDYASSGCPVFDAFTWTVLGMHKKQPDSGSDQYNWAINIRTVVDAIGVKYRCHLQNPGRMKKSRSSVQCNSGMGSEEEKLPDYNLERVRQSKVISEQMKDVICSFLEENKMNSDNLIVVPDTEIMKLFRKYEHHMAVLEWRKEQVADMSLRLLKAARIGNVEGVMSILKLRPEILEKAADKDNNNAILLASFFGRVPVVDYLIDLGANVERKSLDGRTPLHLAAQTGHLSTVKVLVKKGKANIEATDDTNGAMPIHYAAACGHLEVVDYLLRAKPEMCHEAYDKESNLPINMAAMNGQQHIVEFLIIQADANVENRGQCGRTPLIQAAAEGRLPVVRFLVENAGANLVAKDKSPMEDTAIHLAAYFGHENVVNYLLDQMGDLLEIKNRVGHTPLSYAKRATRSKIIHALTLRGAQQ